MLSVQFDVSRLRQTLASEKARVLRVQRRAVYALADQGVKDLRAEMQRVFDRPTRYVLQGMQIAPTATGAQIEWKPGGGRTIPTERILQAQVEGGQRRMKRFERALRLPAGYYAVPGRQAPLDQHGNLSGPYLTGVISALGLFGEQGYRANIDAAREGRRFQKALDRGRETTRLRTYFVVRPGSNDPSNGNLPPGVYKRRILGAGVSVPILEIAFVKAKAYTPRLNPRAVIQRSVATHKDRIWDLALRGQLPFINIRRSNAGG